MEFTARTITSLFLAKSNFNIYNLPNSHEMLQELDIVDILVCMEIANKETAILYKDFIKKATILESIQNNIQNNVLSQFKENNFLTEEEKQDFIFDLELNTHIDEKTLNSIYDSYIKKYEKAFKKTVENSDETDIEKTNEIKQKIKTTSDDSNEQLSLFAPREEELANKLCDIFNSFDTKYQNTFEISNVELQVWEHTPSKKRNLSIII